MVKFVNVESKQFLLNCECSENLALILLRTNRLFRQGNKLFARRNGIQKISNAMNEVDPFACFECRLNQTTHRT